ncbi:MAG: PQQ-binding-like beta-propeller repeat protein [Planctomycetes bacterium]|nr:PQQ-binding-like beta-propeller repeat protein [Planctomycetota bacterium]
MARSLPIAARSLVLAAALFAPAFASDWPRWRGPDQDACSKEKGLLATWPEAGPPLLWRISGLGDGYSSISIAGGRIFTMGDRAPEGGRKEQFIIAIDLASRKELWAARVGPPHGDGGPRSTPTVDGALVYAIGTDGDIVCVEAATGKEIWRKSFARDFGGRMMSGWRYSESPLVDGEKVVCTPGGREATIVALNKKTGETIWTCAVPAIGGGGKDGAAYSSIVAATICGVPQYVQLIGRGVVGVAAKDGTFLWGYNRIANGVASIPTPIVRGDRVFCSTAYGTGSALLRIVRDGEAWKAEEVYFLGEDVFQNHHGGVVLVGDHIYGGHGQNAGAPVCIEFETGKVAWKEKAPYRGSAAVLYADGHLYFRYEKNAMTLVEATPEAYRQKSAFEIPTRGKGPSWPHVVILDGRLYIRHADELICYDIKAK